MVIRKSKNRARLLLDHIREPSFAIGSENMTSRACIVGLGGHVESTVLNKALTASESRFLVENEQLQSF